MLLIQKPTFYFLRKDLWNRKIKSDSTKEEQFPFSSLFDFDETASVKVSEYSRIGAMNAHRKVFDIQLVF